MRLSLVLSLTLMMVPAPRQSEVNDPLPRRGHFGVGLEKAQNGVRVFAVAPGSTAADVGVAVGDVIETIDGRPAESPEAASAAIGKNKSGQSIKLEVRRSDERLTIQAKLKAYPFEQMANSQLHYGSVIVPPMVRLRTILSIPNGQPNGRFPAVLLIQGGGCGSIDSPFNVTVAQPGLMHAIGSQGFVTMRVEKRCRRQ